MAASSSSSSGSMSNFSRLLASSRLTSYQPNVGQVYTAPPAHIARGDFGLKRPLPTADRPLGSIRYVDFGSMDTLEGQTEWNEREREVLLLKRWLETNIKLSPEASDTRASDGSVAVGGLGPRLNTVYDPSTRRALPTFYDDIEQKDLRDHLKREARYGRGPVHRQDNTGSISETDPFQTAAMRYSTSMKFSPSYHSMPSDRFERFLEKIRSSRKEFKDHIALSAAHRARVLAAQKLNERRQEIQKAARRAKEEGATMVDVPAEVKPWELPLPSVEKGAVRSDMWDQSRVTLEGTGTSWGVWLSRRENERASRPENDFLPSSKVTSDASHFTVNDSNQDQTALHPHAGLQYSQPDSIQTQLLSPSIPGRVLDKAFSNEKSELPSRSRSMRRSTYADGWAVGVGGRVAFMPNVLNDGLRSLDWIAIDRERGTGNFRPVQAWRQAKLPNEPSGSAKDTRMPSSLGFTRMTVRASDVADRERLAKGVPGSQQWVAELDGNVSRRSGEGNAMAFDYSDPMALAGFNSKGRNAVSSLYSPRENKRMERQRAIRRNRLEAQGKEPSLSKSSEGKPSEMLDRLLLRLDSKKNESGKGRE